MEDSIAPRPLRVVFYSHDSQGLGHFRRNRALAHAMAARVPVRTGRAVTGLLVNGVEGGFGMSTPDGFDVVSLPSVGKFASGYAARHLGIGLADVTSLRGQIVSATLREFGPDLVVVDRHAFGVHGELRPALDRLRSTHPSAHVVLGLREVLDAPEATAAEWARTSPALVRDLFDEIWVYGDPRVHDLRSTGELPGELAHMVSFQGYLAHGRVSDPADVDPHVPYVLTTVGGGSDGVRLCHVAARTRVPAGHSHLILTGPQMSDADHRSVLRSARPGTTVLRSVPDAAGLIRGAAASISMAGYNTVCESMATDVPALLVPRERPRQEQLIRARGLAAVGAADLLRGQDLDESALAGWLAGATRRRVLRDHLDLGGLRTVAGRAARLARTHAISTPPPAPTALAHPQEAPHVAV